VVDPHHPAELQQFPKVLPRQVFPTVPAQVPSVDTFLVAVAEAAVEVRVVVPTTVEARVEVEMVEAGRVEVETVPPPEEERYQLATGSPRHSPTVTAL